MTSPKRIMVDMSATLLHHGHIRLIRQATQYGTVIIGLTTDEEIRQVKGYEPELSFAERKEILAAITGVAEVVPTPWLLTEEVLDHYRIDLLLHGHDNSNPITPERLLLLPRTEGVSSTDLRRRAQRALISIANRKLMLTPGPAALLPENLSGLRPLFGRGDEEYQQIHATVIDWLKGISGQDQVICAQGSATFALELAAHTFVRGRCLLIASGYYSDRLRLLLPPETEATVVSHEQLTTATGRFDWVLCAYTETARAFKLDLPAIRAKADALGAKLFVDATGSIGLEDGHELADLTAFSSCKGLFGLTGACFVAFKDELVEHPARSFYRNLETHRQRLVTGPYHALASLVDVIPIHGRLRQRVAKSKAVCIEQYQEYIPSRENQPLLCTYLKAEVTALDDKVILYTPRQGKPGSVICHLGEIHHDGVALPRRIAVRPLPDTP